MGTIGQVVKVIAGFFDIQVDQKCYRVRASGLLREHNIVPIVGDWVEFEPEGMLTSVQPRQNMLRRPKVANVDQVVIVCALDDPKFSALLLDRMLATIEAQALRVIILFTKADLGGHQPFYDYQSQGYTCFLINNTTPAKLHELQTLLTHKLSVFTGQSGAGKSTTINHLLGLHLATNPTSRALGRGKHTTRVVEIHQVGLIRIIDTPGFGALQIQLTKHQLARAFHDFRTWSAQCKFRSCLHDQEEDCFVKAQLAAKQLLTQRYQNYLKMLHNDTIETAKGFN